MSSKNTSALLSVGRRSVPASRPFFFVERISVLTPGALQSTTGYGSQLLVSLEWFHAAVPTPFVAKLRKPTVGVGANHHPM
jgi:hypothetical protein